MTMRARCDFSQNIFQEFSQTALLHDGEMVPCGQQVDVPDMYTSPCFAHARTSNTKYAIILLVFILFVLAEKSKAGAERAQTCREEVNRHPVQG